MDPNLLKTFLAHAKRYFSISEAKRNEKSDIHVLQTFKVFVSSTLERYNSDFQKEQNFQKDFYSRFWKTFFDELLIEARRVSDNYSEHVKDVPDLRNDLQRIAEKGLDDFSKLFKPFP